MYVVIKVGIVINLIKASCLDTLIKIYLWRNDL